MAHGTSYLILALTICVHIKPSFGTSSSNNSSAISLTPSLINTIVPVKMSQMASDKMDESSVINNNTDPNQSSSATNHLKKFHLDKSIDSDDKSSSSSDESSSTKTPSVQAFIHVYIILVIGVVPATLVSIFWWIKQKCFRSEFFKSRHRYEDENRGLDQEKYSQQFMMKTSDLDKISIDRLAYQIAKRAEKFSSEKKMANLQQASPYFESRRNILNSQFIKSRRVYSLELPRKCLEMIEILGEGNFGQVWKARTQQFCSAKDKPDIVAVKTNKIDSNVDQQEDLLKELNIMLQLGSHPNVIRLLGCCTENEPYYLVMEYADRGKLLSYLRHHRQNGLHYFESKGYWKVNQEFINNNQYTRTYYPNQTYESSSTTYPVDPIIDEYRNKLSAYQLVEFSYQIAKGMEFISSHGIIHRDLAARNILIDHRNTCKIADFGLSRSVRDREGDSYEMKHGGQMPIRWMSPEALSMGLFSIKSDVWAYGIVLWEIVTLGSTPYVGMSAQEVVNFIRQGNICSQPEHCDDDLYDLMKSCWAYKTDDRFTFSEIKHHLMKTLLMIKDGQNHYIDLEHFNKSLYYFSDESPDEKL